MSAATIAVFSLSDYSPFRRSFSLMARRILFFWSNPLSGSQQQAWGSPSARMNHRRRSSPQATKSRLVQTQRVTCARNRNGEIDFRQIAAKLQSTLSEQEENDEVTEDLQEAIRHTIEVLTSAELANVQALALRSTRESQLRTEAEAESKLAQTAIRTQQRRFNDDIRHFTSLNEQLRQKLKDEKEQTRSLREKLAFYEQGQSTAEKEDEAD
eukprot:TRINITY_DN3921_c0_g3_i1.p1 TRINITY_DN3921_c0_g3~~TRINITY_DN3921_c0_g3_i1.p1  ORF type:complete len:248 (-),score=47.37 TRINITY_DN3921_c0_g3_i1:30-665(-)